MQVATAGERMLELTCRDELTVPEVEMTQSKTILPARPGLRRSCDS